MWYVFCWCCIWFDVFSLWSLVGSSCHLMANFMCSNLCQYRQCGKNNCILNLYIIRNLSILLKISSREACIFLRTFLAYWVFTSKDMLRYCLQLLCNKFELFLWLLSIEFITVKLICRSALQSLNKIIKMARDNRYIPTGLSHTWTGYYDSNSLRSTRVQISEW